MDVPSKFHTQKGYELAEQNKLTAAMEDYLEMICRLSREEGYYARPSFGQTSQCQAVICIQNGGSFERVRPCPGGAVRIYPSNAGGESLWGDYLLYRHNLLNQFLCYINHSDNELEQVERIEHFIDERTIRNIAIFLESAL